MEEISLKIQKHVRLVQSAPLSEGQKHVWIVLHGYGQLPHFTLRKFQSLFSPERCFIAPEGLHRFYLDGTSGRVGASWMTKEARLDDMADQAAYLDQVFDRIAMDAPQAQVHVLGFSQGVSTAFRWVNHRNGLGIKSLTAWAGSFPPDIDYNLRAHAFTHLQLNAFSGTKDVLVPVEMVKEHLRMLKIAGIEMNQHRYDGDHRLYPEILNKFVPEVETQSGSVI